MYVGVKLPDTAMTGQRNADRRSRKDALQADPVRK